MADSPERGLRLSRYYIAAPGTRGRTFHFGVLRSNEKVAYGILNPLKISSQYENGVVRSPRPLFKVLRASSPRSRTGSPVESSEKARYGRERRLPFLLLPLYFVLAS
jgi:hypothetical protein